jgi:16S rRNA (cytidine1402-2'-O)-methyltransferase
MATTRYGRLLLIPTPLGESDPQRVLPQHTINEAARLTHFVAESAKNARHFLKSLPLAHTLQSLIIAELNEHTPLEAVAALLQPALDGHDLGLMSDAGCPGVADPGAPLVEEAHRRGVRVVPLVGPSSILLALIASGLESQRFAFHGYLPVKPPARDKAIRDIETQSRKNRETQIFIETPYRNLQLFNALLTACRADTLLCVATDLTLPVESVRTLSVADWKKQKPDLKDRPSVFLLLAT